MGKYVNISMLHENSLLINLILAILLPILVQQHHFATCYTFYFGYTNGLFENMVTLQFHDFTHILVALKSVQYGYFISLK